MRSPILTQDDGEILVVGFARIGQSLMAVGW